jgi:hypothetical protein
MRVIKFYKQKQKAPLIIDYNHNNKVNEILFIIFIISKTVGRRII